MDEIEVIAPETTFDKLAGDTSNEVDEAAVAHRRGRLGLGASHQPTVSSMLEVADCG